MRKDARVEQCDESKAEAEEKKEMKWRNYIYTNVLLHCVWERGRERQNAELCYRIEKKTIISMNTPK